MTSRERMRATLTHREPDRVPIHDSPWAATVERWHAEGLPTGVSPADYFGYELVAVSCDTSPRYPVQTLEKTDRYIVRTTPTGGINKNFWSHASTPEIVDRPIKEKGDWERMKGRLEPDYTRVDWVTTRNTYDCARSEGQFVVYSGGYGYDRLQGYMRSEELLVAVLTEPEWVKEMITTLGDLTIAMAEMMMDKGFEFDGFFVFNDMGYRNALLFSPASYDETHRETDEKVFSFFHEHDMPIILHSCGCVKELIPTLVAVGLDCLQPLEVKAGMDLIELKGQELGQKTVGDALAFMGGIDVRAMADPNPEAIEDEIRRKFEVAKAGGGYIYHSDHSVPNNVSFQQYCRTMELVKQYGAY